MHNKDNGSKNESVLNVDLTIEQLQKTQSPGIIKIHGLLTVAELEAAFYDTFGLPVQVFRKSGNIWLQTIKTDHWTLAEQNHKGMEKPKPAVDEMIDAKDRMELE